MLALTTGTFLGNYEIVRAIGSGGMGAVYEARHRTLGRRVAIKVIHAHDDVSESEATVARFLREGRAAAQVRHPHVVDVFDFGVEQGRPFLVMELIEGETLAQRLARDGKLSLPLLAEIMLPVLAAVAELHAAGILHRDLKPANILLARERGRDVCPKVADFGVSRLDDGSAAVTESNAVVGTFAYMAPEQARASKYTSERSDQYALGVILHECATGVRPFAATSPLELLNALMNETVSPPSTKNPALPPGFDALVLRALRREPEQRFASVGELAEALLPFADAKIAARWSGQFRAAPASAGDAAPPAPPPGTSSGSPLANTVAPLVPDRTPSRADAEAPITVYSKRARVAFRATMAVGLVVAIGLVALRMTRHASPTSATPPPLASVAAKGACASNSECTARAGSPSICSAHACTVLASPDCHVMADSRALEGEDTLWYGSLYPLTGPLAEMGKLNERAMDLARQDFAQATSGLQAGSGGGPVRSFGLVSCDDGADAARAARHLVNDLHLPAILGFQSGSELVELAGSVLGPNQVLSVATLTTSPQVTLLPRAPSEPPLIWRMTYSLSEAAPALSKVIETVVEPDLHRQGVPRIRVANVRAKIPGMLAFSERLFGALRFNGKNALDNADDYREFVFDGDADPSSPAAYEAGLARLREFEPNVVIYGGSIGIIRQVLTRFEKSWPASAKARPRYLSVAVLGDEAVAFAGRDADLRSRVLGLTLYSSTRVNALFTMHFNEAYGTEVSRANAPSTAYDGFYVAAYAAFALTPSTPVTGPNLAHAIGMLVPPGVAIDVGPSGIFPAYTRLRGGASVDLVGAGGTLDFDLATGEHQADLSVLCLEADKQGNATGSVESGMVYSARTDSLVGKMHCP